MKCYRFYHFAAESLTSFNKDNSANFLGENGVEWSYSRCLLFENTWKNFKWNLVVVVVLALESKGLYYFWNERILSWAEESKVVVADYWYFCRLKKKKIFVLLEYKKSTFMGNIQIYCGVR